VKVLSGLAVGLVQKKSDFKHDTLLLQISGFAVFMIPGATVPDAVGSLPPNLLPRC
jgi:hypothetical protein